MIDLRSDTVTTPTAEMRDAAGNASVGDDVYGEDPTVDELETTVAEMLGTEAALFVPSGTMGNQIAAAVHTDAGQEIVLDDASHFYNWERGGLAHNSGLQVRPLDGGSDGLFTPDALTAAIIESSLHRAGTGLVSIENTHNHAGGVAHSPAALDELATIAHDHDVPVHLDGARVFNAAVALDVPPAALVDPVDTVMTCFSKGLGAPVGSTIAGPAALIEQARKERKRFGGGMRQAGVIAAPALVGLSKWERLAADHDRADRLAHALDGLDGLRTNDPETNIVLVDVADSELSAESFLTAIEAAGVQGVQFGETLVRFCTHRDVDDADIETAVDRIASVVA